MKEILAFTGTGVALCGVMALVWWTARTAEANKKLRVRLETIEHEEHEAMSRASAALARKPDPGELDRRLRDGTF